MVHSLLSHRCWTGAIVCVAFGLLAPAAWAQDARSRAASVEMQITQANQRLEIMVNTSRILTMQRNIPRLFVSNPDVLKATPLSPNQVQISGVKTGVTQVNLWDEAGKIYTVDVIVIRDVSELLAVLKSEFPEADIRVRPLAESIYITGYVPRPEMVDGIVRLAEDYYSQVINGLSVGGVQQVALHVKVMEVSRTKLRQLGLDWVYSGVGLSIEQGAGGILPMTGVPGSGGATIKIVGSDFTAYIDALRKNNLVKLMAEPTLVAMTGRPATFSSGGEFPYEFAGAFGTTNLQWKQWGTRVEFVPIVLGNGHIRLEVRPTVSEVDDTRILGFRPGILERSVDTAVEMKAGQTLALAGLIQSRVEAENRGVPYLADLPWIGRAFSRVEERVNEVELLITVTPEIIGPLDPHQVPQCGPGQLTVSPCDHDLYWNGHLEVPNCCLFGDNPTPVSTPSAPVYDMAPADEPTYHAPSSRLSPSTAPPAGQTPAAMPASHSRPASPPSLYGPVGYDPLP
ncbi:MAG: pilus assembly protein N-terminal domain-containing protein [Pirellulaceae bacterium]|nr:pilus assembly protein N-terminal domain-containing protein [Pirellulaceae bacterium]